MHQEKKLYKSLSNRMLWGVCGGIAEYFELDPTIVRLAWVLFTILGGSGILAYIIAALLMHDAPADFY
ncbi:MAG: PspC domain-containing protein [Clostridia bacterium]|nr:PspC domain-containing protein [Clostridia bacterium]